MSADAESPVGIARRMLDDRGRHLTVRVGSRWTATDIALDLHAALAARHTHSLLFATDSPASVLRLGAVVPNLPVVATITEDAWDPLLLDRRWKDRPASIAFVLPRERIQNVPPQVKRLLKDIAVRTNPLHTRPKRLKKLAGRAHKALCRFCSASNDLRIHASDAGLDESRIHWNQALTHVAHAVVKEAILRDALYELLDVIRGQYPGDQHLDDLARAVRRLHLDD